MNFEHEMICRLCFKKVCQNNCEEIDEIKSEMLDVLLLKLNLSVSNTPVMCNECVKDLQESFEFKSVGLYSEDIIYPLLNSGTKLDLKDIYSKQNNVKLTDISKSQKICRICIKLMVRGFYISLNEKLDGIFKVEDVLHKYIPELKLNATEEPIICLPCLDSLQHLSNFIIVILNVEEKIAKYIETQGISKKEEVKLDNVKTFFSNNENGSDVIIPKLEDCPKANENIANIEITNSLLKLQDISKEIKTEIDKDITVKMEDEEFNEEAEPEICIKKEEIEIKSEPTDLDSVEDIMAVASSSKLSGKKRRSKPERKKTFECSNCPYKTHNSSHILRHSIIHKDPSQLQMYKCEKCPFESKYKYNIEKHMVCHTDPSERMIYKCEHCTFKSIRKELYRKHLIYHENPSAVKVYQCEICEYKTIYKNTYKYHSLIHKSPSEITMLKCDMCPYEAKRKQRLEHHKLIHENSPEARKFQCELCDYKAKCKKVLSRHMITHKDPSEVRMFQCRVCAYQSKYTTAIRIHEVIHKDPSELTTYQCTICTYETKYKNRLNPHMKTHKK